jgi:hypothetical protein
MTYAQTTPLHSTAPAVVAAAAVVAAVVVVVVAPEQAVVAAEALAEDYQHRLQHLLRIPRRC